MQKPNEPDKTKPCWVLFYDGTTALKKKERRVGVKLRLAEYVWTGFTWRRTDTSEEYPMSLYKALDKADWWGRLPEMGRTKTSLTHERLQQVAPLFEQKKSNRWIAANLHLGKETVAKLRTIWKRSIKPLEAV